MKLNNPKPATLRVRRLRERRLRLRELVKEKSDWLLWAVRKYYIERDIDPKTYVPIHQVRTGLITERDFSLSDFFDGDVKLLSAVNPKDVEVAKILSDGQESIIIRPKFL